MAFEITPELIETIRLSNKPTEFVLPDNGKLIVLPNGNTEKFYPKTEKQLLQDRVHAVYVHLTSLAGLAEFVKRAGDEENAFVVKISGPSQVMLWDYSDETDRVLHAQIEPAGLPKIPILEGPVSLDDALIQMQQCFVQDAAVDRVVDVLSTVKIEDLAELTDNGVSKEVTIRARVTGGKSGDANIQGLMLRPLRTFPEIDVIASAFSFRWQRVGEKDIKARLVERQHHLWRYQQTLLVADAVRALLPGIAVLV